MKKIGPIRKKTYTVEGPACESPEMQGFLCKTARVKAGLTQRGGFDPAGRI
jgi:hypothetical protein